MAPNPPHPPTAPVAPPCPGRRAWLRQGAGLALGAAGLAAVPEVRLFAQQVQRFVAGPAVPDIPAQRLSSRVWMVFAPDGFPTPQNQGLMANIVFVVTQQGVVMLDSGCSLQIGQMAIRMIRRVTDRPVVAVFNSHYHGDHWLGNHAFADAFPGVPIHALAHTREQILGAEGNAWRGMMERWTQGASLGTRIVAPDRVVQPGQVFDFGDTRLRLHHHGVAHTPSDLCMEVVEDRVTYVGDVAMGNRIANIDDGSYRGTFKTFDALTRDLGEQLWVPGHGTASRDLLKAYGDFLRGIYEPCLQAVKDGLPLEKAKGLVLADPRVASRAATMQGFESNIGKYTSLAYLEAEKEAF